MANPILTDVGRAYIADQDAAELPVVLNLFKLGNPNVGGSVPSDPLPTQTDQTNVVWTGAPTAEGKLNDDSVVVSLLAGTDQGDFEITQIGLWSDTGVLVYVANIPTYYKRASGPGVFGNNFVFNANIVYAGIAALAGMQAAAETWQQDFTALLALKQDRAEKGQADGYAGLDVGGTVPDAQIPATIARDSEVAVAQAAAQTYAEGYADAAVATHAAAADPHTGYQRESEKGAANGYPGLDGAGLVPVAQIPALTQANIGAAAVGQAQLKSTTGEVSTTGAYPQLAVVTGGEYAFYPQVRTADEFTALNARLLGNPLGDNAYRTVISFGTVSGSGAVYAKHRYVQASPPYDLGDGEIPLFAFAVVDQAGRPVLVSVAPDPPWAHNGPTDICPTCWIGGKPHQERRIVMPRPGPAAPRSAWGDWAESMAAHPTHELVEITQAVKQADMPLIPHPFLYNDLTGKTVVLVDPGSPLAEQLLALHEAGESVNALLHEGYLRLDNRPLQRKGPAGVLVCAAKWQAS